LALARELGFQPQRILDGGAFRGLWSLSVAKLYPDAEYVLVEPNPILQETIAENMRELKSTVVNVALGKTKEKATFNIWQDPDTDTSASLLGHVSGPAKHAIEVNVDTLDNVCERLAFKPDLVKLDLQGGELAALQGARKVLQSAEFAIIEFGVLEAYVGRSSRNQAHCAPTRLTYNSMGPALQTSYARFKHRSEGQKCLLLAVSRRL